MFNFFSTNPCGVKISDSALEVMELSEDRVVETYGRKLLDEGMVEKGEILEKEKLSEMIADLFKDIGVSTERVVLTLPSTAISWERLDFEEKLEGERLKQVIEEELDLDSASDFLKISKEEGTAVLVVKAKQEILNSYLEVIEEAGLKVVRVEPESLALGRSLLGSTEDNQALINFGLENTTLSVFNEKDELTFVRGIEFGAKDLMQAIADAEGTSLKKARQLEKKFGLNKTKRKNKVAPVIKEELQSVLEEIKDEIGYYETNFGPVDKIILSGETALVPSLNDYLAEQLGKMVQVGNPLMNLEDPSYLRAEKAVHPVIFASTIGLSLSEIEDYEGKVNLYVKEEPEEQEEKEIEKKEIVVEKSKFNIDRAIKIAGITLVVLSLGVAGYVFLPKLTGGGGKEKSEPSEQQEKAQQPQEQEEQEEQQQEEQVQVKTMVEIQSTPTGWLRVRGGPGTSYDELDKVDPGQSFPFVSKKNDWYQIELPYGNGWVYGNYVEIGTTTVSNN